MTFSSEVKSLFPAIACTHPLLRAVMMQSAQKRCKHSFVVMVFFNISKQMGHISSLCRLLGDTTISKPSVIASWRKIKSKFFKKQCGNFLTELACFTILLKGLAAERQNETRTEPRHTHTLPEGRLFSTRYLRRPLQFVQTELPCFA